MIIEDYCSFEVAKLLKEKGFDEYCRYFYDCDTPDNGYLSNKGYGEYIHNSKVYDCRNLAACPTHQMAIKWLRKNYYIYADSIKQGNYNDCSEYYTWIVARMGIIHRNSSVVDKLSYEEAVEAALKYALENLI